MNTSHPNLKFGSLFFTEPFDGGRYVVCRLHPRVRICDISRPGSSEPSNPKPVPVRELGGNYIPATRAILLLCLTGRVPNMQLMQAAKTDFLCEVDPYEQNKRDFFIENRPLTLNLLGKITHHENGVASELYKFRLQGNGIDFRNGRAFGGDVYASLSPDLNAHTVTYGAKLVTVGEDGKLLPVGVGSLTRVSTR